MNKSLAAPKSAQLAPRAPSAAASGGSSRPSKDPSVDALARALFGPIKDRAQAEKILHTVLRTKKGNSTTFILEFSALYLPAVMDLHRSSMARYTIGYLASPIVPLDLPIFCSSLMGTEYYAKYIRESPISVGHGLVLAYLSYLERAFRDRFSHLLAEGHLHPLSTRAFQSLGDLSWYGFDLLLTWMNIPKETRQALKFDKAEYTRIKMTLSSFFDSDARSDEELSALLESMAAQNNPWTHGDYELPFLVALAGGDREQMEIIADDAALISSWHACNVSIQGPLKPTNTPCVAVPRGQEMMMCAKCGSVRYCSKAHQRADWKSHKLRCLTVTWDARAITSTAHAD